jgi:tRNA pseudouridine13 synthase
MEGRYGEASRQWPVAFHWQQRACRVLAHARGKTAKAWGAIDRSAKAFLIQAAQSDLFNKVVAERLPTLDQLEPGDIAWRHDNGTCFPVEDVAREQPRCAALEISPTGPLFGERLTLAGGAAGELESRLFTEAGLAPAHLADLGPIAPKGQRRALRVPLAELKVLAGQDPFGPFLRLAFVLPPGSYATAVTREVMKVTLAVD